MSQDRPEKSNEWFSQFAHWSPVEGEPLLYAMACLEVVIEHSNAAKHSFNELVEMFSSPGIKHLGGAWRKKFTDTEWANQYKEAFLSVAKDIHQPFADLPGIGDEVVKQVANEDKRSEIVDIAFKETCNNEDYIDWLVKLNEFVIVYFNRHSDNKSGNIKVQLSNDSLWLFFALMFRCAMEASGVSLRQLVDGYKIAEVKGKKVDMEDILLRQPNSRIHRKMTKASKASALKLHNDQTFIETAELWYKCRIEYSSVYAYCKAADIESKPAYRRVKKCDDALGYTR